VVHRRLLWAEVHGRDLWLDPIGVGTGRNPLAHSDRARSPEHRNVRAGNSGDRGGDGLLARAADPGPIPPEGSGREQAGTRGVTETTGVNSQVHRSAMSD